MNHQSIDYLPNATSQHPLAYPLHKIVAAVAPPDAGTVVAMLGDAGFGPDRVEVVTADEIPRLEEPIGGTGLHRFLVRLQLSMGDDLDQLELARRELMNGHTLIQILVHGDQEQDRVRAILGQHGGHAMHYFGRWTITPLDQREY
jgi:hypothetical protein